MLTEAALALLADTRDGGEPRHVVERRLVEAGASGRLVAASLGHRSKTVTFTSYVAARTKEAANAKAALHAIQGGKRDGEFGIDCSRIDPNGVRNAQGAAHLCATP